MNGAKAPGSSGNETGTGLPPSLTGWVDDLDNINYANVSANLKSEAADRQENKQERQKKRRFKNNAPKNAQENAEFIKAGGGSRPAF